MRRASGRRSEPGEVDAARDHDPVPPVVVLEDVEREPRQTRVHVGVADDALRSRSLVRLALPPGPVGNPDVRMNGDAMSTDSRCTDSRHTVVAAVRVDDIELPREQFG